jgi:Winged helix-turn helix
MSQGPADHVQPIAEERPAKLTVEHPWFPYPRGDFPADGACWLRLYQAPDRPPALVFTEFNGDRNPGASVENQLPAIDAALRQGPAAHGFATTVWISEHVRVVIEQVTGVQLTPSVVRRLLRERLGWSVQRP